MKILKTISNIPGWRTSRKIVVIESDDWGSIRMSSQSSYNALVKAGLNLSKGAGGRYNMYDTLASKEDLSMLFEVLTSVKDKNNASAKITAVSLVANPDFEKIKTSGYNEYFYEPFTKTLEKYNRIDAFELWKEGKNSNIFVPEFHGREHLNISAWIRALKKGDKDALLAFENGIWGYTRKQGEIEFQSAFNLEFSTDVDLQKEVIKDGLNLFKELHGYKARFFVPPNGPINNSLEPIAAENGIEYMSSPKIQTEVLGEGKIKKHFRYIGKKNKYGQTYITRNSFFEPSGTSKDEVDSCLAEIEMAFKWKKPAIISSHRINYIGGLSSSKRDKSLEELKELLQKIVKKWPDVEFMTSSELGDVITKRD
ncbi:hypothetical protein GCM10007424_10040 [Flavobacterium suaedae]|uniref:Polysaccharide (De)acetylase n=1 Tax=Flavobacterium suaedae TaxID=1767027 RepID=A0ABQ1JQG8_9FLAO|nr:polysaccharide (de)acetylase [Flavobacterium suaedae]GGB72041.1 hypothetical protein GCM10007424_10040 [Flavobacterium suaedae]